MRPRIKSGIIPAILLLFIALADAAAQSKEDRVWVIGHGGEGMTFDFAADPPAIAPLATNMYHYAANASICDTAGKLLFYTNAVYVADATHQAMENSTLDLGLLTATTGEGVNVPQIVLILPLPGHEGLYYLFNKALYSPTPVSIASRVYYSVIDMSLNGGLGKVVEKNHVVLEGVYLDWGELTACRHANGRDWWILLGESDANRYYRYLLTPEGLQDHGTQAVGLPVFNGSGQAVFAPDGTRYARLNQIDVGTGNFIDLYDFDRCTGALSNHLQIHYVDSSWAGGLAISPDSRFLYVSSQYRVYQYDLQASDIPASVDTVGVYDGFLSPFEASFFLAQLAADGKIYLNAPNGVDVMHVIRNPNEKGAACDFAQHSIPLPAYNAFSMPNFPCFNLGALAGSVCDTLTVAAPETVLTSPIAARISPNPVREYLRLQIAQPFATEGSFRVFDGFGKEVLSLPLRPGQTEFEFAVFLPAGIYFYEVEGDRRRAGSGKLAKM